MCMCRSVGKVYGDGDIGAGESDGCSPLVVVHGDATERFHGYQS